MSENRPRHLLASRDARLYQIGSLAALLLYGKVALALDVTWPRIALLVLSALASQLAFTRLFRLSAFDPRSAMISGLSLCLLLRAGSDGVAVLAAAAAVGSKFLIRWNGKHVFNPTNFGLVAALLATNAAWVSPAQWGSAAFFGFLVLCAGGLVVTKAARADVTLAFLGAFLLLVAGRSLWLGEPLAIPLHRLQSGALLIFAFFMISDPKTTPDSRAGRVLFGVLVAAGAAFVQFRLFRTNGPLWSLAVFSLWTPLIDLLLPGRRFAWKGRQPVTVFEKGVSDETCFHAHPVRRRSVRRRESRSAVLRLLRGEGGREAL